MPRLKIGILTFHHIPNEGAILQAFCLREKLAHVFDDCDVEIIDYRSLCAEKMYFKFAFFSSKNSKTIIQRVKRYYRLRSFVKKNLPLSIKKLVSDDMAQAIKFLDRAYDVIVVGSDEIWKLEESIRPFPNVYWLRPEIHCKKIAYAASANKLAFRKLNMPKVEYMRECLNDFELMAVRDDHTIEFTNYLKLAIAHGIHKVPDPTLVWDVPEIDMKEYLTKRGIDFRRKVFGTTFVNKDFMPELLAHYKSQDYQIVALNENNPYADVNLAGDLDPFEWANIFRYFDVCCTNLFHGTIFSIKAGIPFISFDYFNNSEYDTKVHCLLKEFDLLPHYLPMHASVITTNDIIGKIDQAVKIYNRASVIEKIVQRSKVADRFFCLMREAVG